MHRLLAIAALVLSFGIPSAEAAKRVALVIGNDSYKSLPDLNNARTDARGMAAKLKELGWSVILRQDASRRDISRSLADFEGRLKNAEVGLVFYAGHGIQKDGANYLVPSNAQIEVEEDLLLEGVEADQFLKTMERAGAPLNIVILDACRDNPLPKRSRSGARGLSTPVIPKGIKGTAILYSAAPGQVAQDGPRGGHGVFTGELLKVLDRPGLKLEEVFKQTATKVAAATNGSQDPWINSSVKGDFFFREGKATPTASVPSVDKETVFWQSIANSDDPTMFEAYLKQYPKGSFAPLAQARIAALKRRQVAVARPPAAVKPTPKATPVVGVYPSLAPGKTFRDCETCPDMVVIPAGSFKMGDLSGAGDEDEKPVHKVRIDYSFAVGKYEVTRGEFAKFITKTGYDAGNSCYVWAGTKWESRSGKTWRDPGYSQTDRDPVACVSWDDVKAYVDWMSRKSGKEYRILSESEWEYIARAGSTSEYPFGAYLPNTCVLGRLNFPHSAI
jgi:hypothetical protein